MRREAFWQGYDQALEHALSVLEMRALETSGEYRNGVLDAREAIKALRAQDITPVMSTGTGEEA